MGAAAGCASLAGFAQMALGIALLIVSNNFHHAGPSSCVYGAAKIEQATGLCDVLTLLAWLSVTSSLIISVAQGAVSLVLRVPPRGIELLGRLALGLSWVGAAIFTTIVTVQADQSDHNPNRTHWRHVGLGVAWAMAVVSLLMGVVAVVGTVCVDLPMAVLCCCFPCLASHTGLGQHYNCCQLTGLACCLYWCLPRSWLPPLRPDDHPPCHDPAHAAYQPLPHTPPRPTPTFYPHSRPSPGPYQPAAPHPAGGPSQPYNPPHILHTDQSPFIHHSPGIGDSPMMAPVYAPFAAGPTPHTVGWGVPVAPPPRLPYTAVTVAPDSGIPRYPSVPRATGAWYPPDSSAGGAAPGQGGSQTAAPAASAPPLPEPHK